MMSNLSSDEIELRLQDLALTGLIVLSKDRSKFIFSDKFAELIVINWERTMYEKNIRARIDKTRILTILDAYDGAEVPKQKVALCTAILRKAIEKHAISL